MEVHGTVPELRGAEVREDKGLSGNRLDQRDFSEG